MEGYVYQPLRGPRSFRVLHIINPLQDGPVTGELREYNLDSCPPYQALSYAWEGSARERPIHCDGRILFVTKSAEAAIRRLIYGKLSRPIWVDSICINQGDNNERSQQVSMMGDVYRKAERVNVWLGPGTEGSDAAMAELKSLSATALLAMAPGPFPQWRRDRFQKQVANLEGQWCSQPLLFDVIYADLNSA
jgi:Heterokaryon incompatibility protein (HET)